jgi:succinyl-diaminopimelate desuccinylase
VVHANPPHRADRDRPEIAKLQKAALDQGYRSGLLRRHGASDGRFYSQRGMDAVLFGVGGEGQHGADEYADIPTIPAYHRALTAFLLDPGPL